MDEKKEAERSRRERVGVRGDIPDHLVLSRKSR